jgi:hypothetical protein
MAMSAEIVIYTSSLIAAPHVSRTSPTQPVSDLAGQIHISLTPGGHPAVFIGSTRPLTAARVFAGKPVATVTGQLPLLFSVCGTAQAVACANACEAALGLAPAPSARRARTLLLHAETAKEHLWRLLLDWPKALAPVLSVQGTGDLPVQSTEREVAMATAMRAFLQLRSALGTAGDPFLPGAGPVRPAADVVESACARLATTAAELVFGAAPASWLAATATGADLQHWAAATPTLGAALVRALTSSGLADLGRCNLGTLPGALDGSDSALVEHLVPALAAADGDAFIAAPTLDGVPAETTPFAREQRRGGLVADLASRYGNGLLPRLGALLAELARNAALLASPAAASAPTGVALEAGAGSGLGAAPAARGLLLHRVVLAGGATPAEARARDYRILAPTEWNFHPRGVVAAGLEQLMDGPLAAQSRPDRGADAHATLKAVARLLVTAVDPCVDYRLSVC